MDLLQASLLTMNLSGWSKFDPPDWLQLMRWIDEFLIEREVIDQGRHDGEFLKEGKRACRDVFHCLQLPQVAHGALCRVGDHPVLEGASEHGFGLDGTEDQEGVASRLALDNGLVWLEQVWQAWLLDDLHVVGAPGEGVRDKHDLASGGRQGNDKLDVEPPLGSPKHQLLPAVRRLVRGDLHNFDHGPDGGVLPLELWLHLGPDMVPGLPVDQLPAELVENLQGLAEDGARRGLLCKRDKWLVRHLM